MRNSLLRWLLWFLCSAGAALISPYSTKPHTSISLYTGQDQTSECRDESQMAQENESRTRIVLVSRIYPCKCNRTCTANAPLTCRGHTQNIPGANRNITAQWRQALVYSCMHMAGGGKRRPRWGGEAKVEARHALQTDARVKGETPPTQHPDGAAAGV